MCATRRDLTSGHVTSYVVWLLLVPLSIALDSPPVTVPPTIAGRDNSSDCILRGFPGATLNRCGYCVGGDTELEPDYGVDCNGTCGIAFVDCAGKCNGRSYLDECTQECVSSDQELNDAGSSSQSVRDCRRLCNLFDVHDFLDNDYVTDDCGICISRTSVVSDSPLALLLKGILKPRSPDALHPEVTSNSNITTALHGENTVHNTSVVNSAFADCAGKCYTPATVGQMAVMSEETCNQCVAKNSTQMTTLHDACGQCVTDLLPCPCPKADQDACGVCGGHNDTCTTIISAYPTIVSSDTATVVNAVGVTLKSKYHAVCLLIRRDILNDGQDEWKFPAEVDDTSVTCSVTAPEGMYNLHLAVTLENGDVLTYSNTSLPFLVYSKSASIKSMTPTVATIPREPKEQDRLTVAFTAQQLQRIEQIFCTVYGTGYDKQAVVSSTQVTESTASCDIPYPTRSSVGQINVTLDMGPSGTLAGPLNLTFYSTAPNVTRFVPLPEGDRLLIFFDRNVMAANVTSTNCTDLFDAPSMKLIGDNATCVWVTKRQLMVIFGRLAEGTVFDSENVLFVFKEKSIFADNETYSESASNLTLEFRIADELPRAILVGPSLVVPPCGDFILDGHQSAGLQSRRARFGWSVEIGPITFPVLSSNTRAAAAAESTDGHEDLMGLLKNASDRNEAFVVVQSSYLKYDLQYEFKLTVSNGPPEDILSDSAKLQIVRSRDPVPAVFIEPSVVKYRRRVYADTRITLTAHLDKPTCLSELYSIHFRWSTRNPRVKFDVLQMNSSSYTIEPYTLPPHEKVTFDLDVWLNNDPNIASRANVTLVVLDTGIQAVLSGGQERSVGVSSGLLELNASSSYDRTTPDLPLVYRWDCVTEQDGNPCYNYFDDVTSSSSSSSSVQDETLLVNRPIDRTGVLAVPTNRLRAGDRLTFRVRAFSPLNTTLISMWPQKVVVHVTNGSNPMVTIDTVLPHKQLHDVTGVGSDSTTSTSWSSTQTGSAHERQQRILSRVPYDVHVQAVAMVQSIGPIVSVKWQIPGLDWDLTPYTMNEEVAVTQMNRTTLSTVIVRKDYLVANGQYSLNVTATDDEGQSGWATICFDVSAPITNCRITVAEYEAFTMTYVNVDGCAAARQSYPLRYEAFVIYKGSPMSISSPAFHLPISIMGPPAMPERPTDDRSNDSTNVFVVQVCDVLGSCWMFNSSRTRVRPLRDLQAAAEHAFAMANIAKLTNNYLTCLRRHAFYLMEAASDPVYLAENDLQFESQLAQAYVCARKVADIQCVEAGCFASLFTFLTAIPINSRTSREYMMTEVLDRALRRIDAQNVTLTAAGVQEAFLVLEAIYRFNESDVEVAQAVASMKHHFQSILARSLADGESPILMDIDGEPVVAMHYNGLDSNLQVVSNTTANGTVTVLFGNDFRQKYETWTCRNDQQDGSSICRGVVSELQLYPRHVFRPVNVNEAPNRTVSGVVTVNLLNPLTGDPVRDARGTITLSIPVDRKRMSDDLEYECHFYDMVEDRWSRKGMKTLDGGGGTVDCEADHLATFVVIGSEPRMSPWVIAVIVVSTTIVVLVLAGGAFFAYRRSRTKSMRVSISRG